MFDFLALAIMRQFIICGTLDLTLVKGSGHQLQGRSPGPHASITIHDRATFLRLAAKLNLRLEHRVLDIGCGWGGLAMAMAECRESLSLTGITLSKRQPAHARKTAAAQS